MKMYDLVSKKFPTVCLPRFVAPKIRQIKLMLVILMIIPTHTLFGLKIVKAAPITEDNIIALINIERAKRNLPLLRVSPELANAARLKSKDMVNRDYFEHYAFGVSPWDLMKNAGYDYLYAGENLAMDFRTSEGIVRAWMNSPTHRDNLLNPDFEDVGVGVVKGVYTEEEVDRNTIMVTNMLGREKPRLFKFFDRIRSILPLY